MRVSGMLSLPFCLVDIVGPESGSLMCFCCLVCEPLSLSTEFILVHLREFVVNDFHVPSSFGKQVALDVSMYIRHVLFCEKQSRFAFHAVGRAPTCPDSQAGPVSTCCRFLFENCSAFGI
jgi:hypothetical protein